MSHAQIVLASTSPFRKELLHKLGLPFETANPATDESLIPGETPEATALRLSEAKARAVASQFPDALIIGSDQVACLDGQIFGKPGTARFSAVNTSDTPLAAKSGSRRSHGSDAMICLSFIIRTCANKS